LKMTGTYAAQGPGVSQRRPVIFITRMVVNALSGEISA